MGLPFGRVPYPEPPADEPAPRSRDFGGAGFGGVGREVSVPEAVTDIGSPVLGGVGAEVPVPEADTGPPAFDFGTFLLRRDVRPSKASGVGTLSWGHSER